MSTTMTHRIGAAVASLALAGGLAACTSASAGPAPTTTTSTATAAPTQAPADSRFAGDAGALASAFSTPFEHSRTAVLAIDLKGADSTQHLTLEVDGRDKEHTKAELTGMTGMDVVWADDQLYLKTPMLKKYLRTDAKTVMGLLGLVGGHDDAAASTSEPALGDGADQDDVLKVTKDGSEDVDGVSMTKYSVTVDRSALGGDQVAETFNNPTLPMSVWVDPNGQARKIAISTVPGLPGTSLDATIDWSASPEVAAPVADQVQDMPSGLGSLLDAVGGAQATQGPEAQDA